MLKTIKNLPFYLRLKRARVTYGEGCFAMGRLPTIKNQGHLKLGIEVAFRCIRSAPRLEVGPVGHLSIGDGVFINDGVNVYCGQNIEIGANTKIGDWVNIYDTDFHPISPTDAATTAPVRIGKNVWIGAKAMILAGADIGDHAVIAAGSIVRGRVEPRTVVSGIPAKPLRQFECPNDWIRP